MKATRSNRAPLAGALPHDTARSSGDPRKQVVGVILSDGTVYTVPGTRDDSPRGPWSQGRFSGSGWTLWWERRVTTEQGRL